MRLPYLSPPDLRARNTVCNAASPARRYKLLDQVCEVGGRCLVQEAQAVGEPLGVLAQLVLGKNPSHAGRERLPVE